MFFLDCVEVTNAGLSKIFLLPKLKSLDIEGLTNITDDFIAPTSNLTYMYTRGCTHLGDKALAMVIQSSEVLQTLDVSVTNITINLIRAAVAATAKRRSDVLKLILYDIDVDHEEANSLNTSPFLHLKFLLRMT